MTKQLATTVLLGAGLIAGACYVETGPPARRPLRPPPPAPAPAPTMTPASASSVSIESAADALSVARCDREARCNNIGPRARYATYDHCRGVQHDDIQARLQACRYGIQDQELAICVEETRYDECGAPERRGEWRRVPACNPQNLCVR